ncbi:transcriptional regulator (plasmid) [Azospirillum sp. B510]|uniref:LuxR C-terminal-related transcriptional regulator n=2 Tax=Alphaproteobacteria TaxID=28211 RepID=UPI0001C4B864|nr:LuxR C-terminal-related transcriptional regulator [Azospirillum sp. B510]BAI74619.1 transcriptional regulator [Azospirillum sp. B510]
MVIDNSSHDPALTLKSMPPRAVRGFLNRDRLQLSRIELRGAKATVMLAPTGFGKTSQLIQWGRDALARGGLAFWLSLDHRDDPFRLVRGLICSARSSCGKRGFSDSTTRWIEDRSDPQDALTGWLAEVADLAVDVLLLLDDAHLLPSQTRSQLLPFLLNNAPANLHIALAARPTGALMASGALSTVTIARVLAPDLRFRLDEAMAVLSAALGGRCNPEAALQLHELTEGWPLGIQLAVAALQRSGDMEGLLSAATADIRRYFIDTLIDRQSADAVHLLVRLAHFDPIHPDLCAAVLGNTLIVQELHRIYDETPLLLRSEGGDWMRLHPLARAVLRERLGQLPAAERQRMSQAATAWYADRKLYEEAAQHALLAGDGEIALSLVERHTHSMTTQGKSATVLDWYSRLSPDAIKRHPGFWAPVAWAFAMGERNAEVQPLIDLIMAQPDLPDAARFEADLIRVTAAGFTDRVDVMTEVLAQWPTPPLQARQGEAQILGLTRATLALYDGQPDQARLALARVAIGDGTDDFSPMSSGFTEYCTGLSHLWEGRYSLASRELRPALARAEERLGRRHPVACMLAALLAQANWESEQGDDPVTLMAGRLPVLERYGLPDALIAAYTTLARIADHGGRQDLALDRLESLQAIGRLRGMPRLQVSAQFELVRLHVRHGRHDTARSHCDGLDGLVQRHRDRTPEPFLRWIDLHAELARGYTELARNDRTNALQAIEAASALAEGLKRGGNVVETRFLRADLLQCQGSPEACAVLGEAISLAQASGMCRSLRAFANHGRDLSEREPKETVDRGNPAIPTTPKELHALGAGLLTTKEREVLTLLSRNLSNKEIARAMDIGEQTIKWHMKNLFGKLNAAGRKHAVARARLLGLVDA